MMRSMWSAVTGLKAHQTEMDVIGNNIANVNTTAYKSKNTGFSDVLYQTVKASTGAGQGVASTNPSQVGLGAKMSQITTNITAQGSAQTTDSPLDIMITGDSFFIVNDGNNNAYTRNGSFNIDGAGNLVTNNNGYYVQGWMGDNQAGGIGPLRILTEATQTLEGVKTGDLSFVSNIDSDDELLEEGKNVSVQAFGNDGNAYELRYVLTDAGDDDDNTFRMTLAGAKTANGVNIDITGNDFAVDLVYSAATGTLVSAGGNANGIVTQNFAGNLGVLGNVNLDFSTSTNYADKGTSSFNAKVGDVNENGKGYPTGTLKNISVTTDGSIYGAYTNGESAKIGQIAVAQFSNASGLESEGDDLYGVTPNSGEPIIQTIDRTGGYMNTGVLEASNVNLANEFTNMITTQRGFQANSKVITTSDEMLQTLRSLKT